MEAMKTTTKFLLKQMIKDSASKGQMHQGYAALKQQCIDQKQQIASMQDCHQRALNEVNNKLQQGESKRRASTTTARVSSKCSTISSRHPGPVQPSWGFPAPRHPCPKTTARG
ncbi:hypothetical protein MHU86_9082 [Fragilaria crotonensis]|nr:hypothetical protein MHU86_9082 [Fragilaria crotonensis]